MITSNQEISVLIEKIARNLQSAIWVLQNTMEDLQRLGVLISEINRELQDKKENKTKTKEKK